MQREEQYADLMALAEALLFVSDEPVASASLAEMAGVLPIAMDEALALLAAEYADEHRGMRVVEVAGGWQMLTAPEHHDVIERYVISWDTRKLSQAALEALATIAYHQPVTRAGVSAVRGVNSDGVVASLVEKGLVRERGRDKDTGAVLYATTRTFLERFGLSSIDELPPLADFAPDEEARALIAERLGSVGEGVEAQPASDDDEVLVTLTRDGARVGEDAAADDASADGGADGDAAADAEGDADGGAGDGGADGGGAEDGGGADGGGAGDGQAGADVAADEAEDDGIETVD